MIARRPHPAHAAAVAALAGALLAAAAAAQPPEPVDDAALFTFPAALPSPSSAAAAGRALADRWLGEDPDGNPAGVRAGAVRVSPMLLRASRQDLRVDNRRYDEQPLFVDGAGASLSLGLGRIGLALYAHQPVVRREDNAFERGDRGGPVEPAVVQSRTTAREVRAGLALASGRGALRLGAAIEWTRRDDEYFVREASGSPGSGDRLLTLAGDGLGAQAGVLWEPQGADGRWRIGAAARWVPELDLEGESVVATRSLDTTFVVAGRREGGLEGGLSASVLAARAFRLMIGVGGAPARGWRGLAVETGAALGWSLAGEYADPDEPWRVRFGVGQDHEEGAREPRALRIGLGVGWRLDAARVDVGVLRRSIDRGALPTSFDDRIVATLAVAL